MIILVIRGIQITLRILKALIDKSSRDLPFFAPSVLRILDTVLSSKDLTTIEDSIATLESFCERHDGPSSAAGQGYLQQFETILGRYARLALDPTATTTKDDVSTPIAIRWRAVGLQAIDAVTSSETLGVDGTGQLTTIMAVILGNLDSKTGADLRWLQQRALADEQAEDEKVSNRRMSLATVRTTETVDPHPAAFLPTTAETDQAAQDELSVIAFNSLKRLFSTNNRGQIRAATALILDFIVRRTPTGAAASEKNAGSVSDISWATTLLEMTAQWVPVQDRYIILLEAMEALMRRPVAEDDLRSQLLLSTLIGSLLRSDVNLIGLSVMDVLVGLIRRLLSVLELGRPTVDLPSFLLLAEEIGPDRADSEKNGRVRRQHPPVPSSPSLTSQLLGRLQKCTSDLATHVYYSDQISDMVAVILLRLKPTPQIEMDWSTNMRGSRGGGDSPATTNHGSPREKVLSNEYFTSGEARVVGLRVVTEILRVAHLTETSKRSATSSRNRVGIEVWDGTHWLLRDGDGRVRKAYVEALLVWLEWEVTRKTVRTWAQDRVQSKRADSGRQAAMQSFRSSLLKTHSSQPSWVKFLPLLHVAIYDGVMDGVGRSSEILMMHLLLTGLVEKLSVVAVRYSLPMIFRLQEEIPQIESATAKIRLAGLVHGYLWSLSERFDFGSSWVGRAIIDEIGRRKSKGMWMDGIQIPPVGLERINTPGEMPDEGPVIPSEVIHSESLKAFDHRSTVIELIGRSWSSTIVSPPGSPASSPTRKQTRPILEPPIAAITSSPTQAEDQLPPDMLMDMATDWNREVVVASCQTNANSKSVSMDGSRGGVNHYHHHHSHKNQLDHYGNNTTGRDLLAVTFGGPSRSASRKQSPHSPQEYIPPPHQQHHPSHQQHHPSHIHNHGQGSPSPSGGSVTNFPTVAREGHGSLRELRHKALREAAAAAAAAAVVGGAGSSTPLSQSSRSSIVRVDDLKLILHGQGSYPTSSAGEETMHRRREGFPLRGGVSSESIFTERFEDVGDGGGVEVNDFAGVDRSRGMVDAVSPTSTMTPPSLLTTTTMAEMVGSATKKKAKRNRAVSSSSSLSFSRAGLSNGVINNRDVRANSSIRQPSDISRRSTEMMEDGAGRRPRGTRPPQPPPPAPPPESPTTRRPSTAPERTSLCDDVEEGMGSSSGIMIKPRRLRLTARSSSSLRRTRSGRNDASSAFMEKEDGLGGGSHDDSNGNQRITTAMTTTTMTMMDDLPSPLRSHPPDGIGSFPLGHHRHSTTTTTSYMTCTPPPTSEPPLD